MSNVNNLVNSTENILTQYIIYYLLMMMSQNVGLTIKSTWVRIRVRLPLAGYYMYGLQTDTPSRFNRVRRIVAIVKLRLINNLTYLLTY